MRASAVLPGPFVIGLVHALVSPDGTGRLPALGWNSWNEFGCDISEDLFIGIAEKMTSLGLKELGYEYINIDDCWSDKTKRRDPQSKEIIPDYQKFPMGINHTADQIHAMGFKLGIYSDAGTDTCGGYAGSLGYEDIDAATFSRWGIDYLKYDTCNVPQEWVDQYRYFPQDGISDTPPPGYDWGTSKTATRYNAMRDALLKQNRTIQYSLCAWGHAHVEDWGNNTGHSWRMWGDIYSEWTGKYGDTEGGIYGGAWGLMTIVNQASFYWNTTNFWGHNDWDMLEVGIGNLTYEENRSHFALWAALKSPLIIGTPLDNIEKPMLEILSNKELIDFNQDAVYGASAYPYKWGINPDDTSNVTHPAQYWTGTSVKGIHVFMLNTQEEEETMWAVYSELPGLEKNGTYLVHDMWTGKDLGVYQNEFSVVVKKHDTVALRFTGANGTHPNPTWTL